MGRVLQHQPPFMQGFDHQGHVALTQVAHPAVNQFGAATGGPLGEIVLFEQQGAIPAAGRIQSHPQAGGAAPHHDHVPIVLVGLQGPDHLRAIHLPPPG